MPGFVSEHDHLIATKWTSYGVDLSETKTVDEALEKIKAYANANPDKKVILGYGFNRLTYGRWPNKAELDTVISDRPAFLLDFTIHDAWLNSKAFEAGGVPADVKDPVPDTIYWQRDDKGELTGISIEFAWFEAYIAAGAWQPKEMIAESHQEYMAYMVGTGMTTFHAPAIVTPNATNVTETMVDFDIAMKYLKSLEDAGKLPMRTFTSTTFKTPEADPETIVEQTMAFQKKYNSDMLRVVGIKIHPEGNWVSKTSLMLEPYLDDGSYGGSAIGEDQITEMIMAASKQDLDVTTHCDGNATLRFAVDAIIKSREAGYDMRHSVDHVPWIHPDELEKIKKHHILVNTTPMFATDKNGDPELALKIRGEKLTYQQYALANELINEGYNVSQCADVPSSPLSDAAPLVSVEASVTLKDVNNENSVRFPPEGVRDVADLAMALKTVTIYPAYQLRMEDKIGSIEVGKYADLVILEKNLFDLPPNRISETKVNATILEGKYTYRDGI